MRMNAAKKAAAYHVSRSAVKKICSAKSGMARSRLTSPVRTNIRGRRDAKRITDSTIKPIS